MMHSSRMLNYDENSSSAADGTLLFAAPPPIAANGMSVMDVDEQTTATPIAGVDTEDSLIPRPPPPQPRAHFTTPTSATRTESAVPYFATPILHGASHSDSSSQLTRADRVTARHEDACAMPPTDSSTSANQAPPHSGQQWASHVHHGDSRASDGYVEIAADEESVSYDLRAAAADRRRAQAATTHGQQRPEQDSSPDEGCLFGAPRNMNTPPPKQARQKQQTTTRGASGTTAPPTEEEQPPEDETRKASSRDSAGQFFRQLLRQHPLQAPAPSTAADVLESGLRTPAAPGTPTSALLPVTQTPMKQRRTTHKAPSNYAGAGSGGYGTSLGSQPSRRHLMVGANGNSNSGSANPRTSRTTTALRMASTLPQGSGCATGAYNSGGLPKYHRSEAIANGSRKRSLEVASQLNALDLNQGVDQLTPQSYAAAQQHPANQTATVASLLFPSSPTVCGSPSCSPVPLHSTVGHHRHQQLPLNAGHNSSNSIAFGDVTQSPVFSVSQPPYSNWDRLSYSQSLLGGGGVDGAGGGYAEASQADQELSALLARRILTDFREVHELGRGSFGRVTLYEECRTGQYVAVKASMPFHDRDGQGRRFRREKTIMGMLRNVPHIVQLSAAWEDGGATGGGSPQQLFLQLEYCPGGSVAALAAAMRDRGERWDEHELRTFMVHMAIALDAMHTRNIAHVDFKPDNILIDAAGQYKLSDFGCSVPLDEQGRPCSLRQAACAQAGQGLTPQHAPMANHAAGRDRDGGARDEQLRAPPPTDSPVPRFQFSSLDEQLSQPFNPSGAETGVAAVERDITPAPPTLTLAMMSKWASSNHNGAQGGGGSSPPVLGAHYGDYQLLHRELTQTSVASVDEGDCRYLCADMLNAKQHFKAGDLFSLGMSMVELMIGDPLPRNGEAFLELRAHPPRARLLERGYSAELVDLVVRLLAEDPAERPTARDVLLTLRPTSDVCQTVLACPPTMRSTYHTIATSGPSAQTRYLQAALEGTLWLLQSAQDAWNSTQALPPSSPTPAATAARTARGGNPMNAPVSPSMSYVQGPYDTNTMTAGDVASAAAAAGRIDMCTPVTQLVGTNRRREAAFFGAPWPDSQ